METSENQQSIPRLENHGYDLIVGFETGGRVMQHFRVNCNEPDYLGIKEVAYDKAMEGYDVIILPQISESDSLRNIIFKGAKRNKCPDLLINGIFVEVKTPLPGLHERKISTNIKYGHDQADHVIIRLTEHFSSGKLYNIAKGRFKTHETLQVIEFKMSGRFYIFEKWKVLKIRK
jgi:hypothetical protein